MADDPTNDASNPYATPKAVSQTDSGGVAVPSGLRIESRAFASRNQFLGNVLAPLLALGALINLVTALDRGIWDDVTLLHLMVNALWMVLMCIVYVRRQGWSVVPWIELGDQIVAGRIGGENSYSWASVIKMEYEGVRNRTRVPVVSAPFPLHDARVLVITLAGGDALRVRVEYEHDAELKRLATQWKV